MGKLFTLALYFYSVRLVRTAREELEILQGLRKMQEQYYKRESSIKGIANFTNKAWRLVEARG